MPVTDATLNCADSSNTKPAPTRHTDAASAVVGIEDLEPTPNDALTRTWNWKVFAAAWCVMIVNPGSISCGAALLSLGLSPLEATASHFVGGVILMATLQLQAWSGVKYGIPFPVLARASFGTVGAHFCTLSRGLVAIMWLAWQLWQGTLGICIGIDTVFGENVSASGRLNAHLSCFQLFVFLSFTMLHAIVIWLGIERFRILIYVVAPMACFGFVAIAIWASTLATFEEAMHAPHPIAQRPTDSHALAWVIGITSSVATWSTLVLNVCDLSRFCPTQRDQIIGQAVGLPLPFTITGFVGIWVAGATSHAYGVAMWQVPEYFGKFSPLAAAISAVVLAASLLIVNVLANVVSPINDLMNLAPKRFSFRGCGYFCLVLGILVCPWWAFSDESGFILSYLNGYAVITGAITGILICDYWIIKGRILDLQPLYKTEIAWPAVNWRAFLSVALAITPCVPGFLDSLPGLDLQIPFYLSSIYSASWFFTVLVAGSIYWLLSTSFGDQLIAAGASRQPSIVLQGNSQAACSKGKASAGEGAV